MMKFTDFFPRRRFAMEYSHFPGELIILNETMSHFDSLRLHRMIFTEDVLSDLFVVDICDWVH